MEGGNHPSTRDCNRWEVPTLTKGGNTEYRSQQTAAGRSSASADTRDPRRPLLSPVRQLPCRYRGLIRQLWPEDSRRCDERLMQRPTGSRRRGRRHAHEPDWGYHRESRSVRPALWLPETHHGHGGRLPVGCYRCNPRRGGPRLPRRAGLRRDPGGRFDHGDRPRRPRGPARAGSLRARRCDGRRRKGEDAAPRADRLPHPHVHARSSQAGDRLRRDARAGHVHRPVVRGPDAVGGSGGEGRRPRRPAIGRDTRHGPRRARDQYGLKYPHDHRARAGAGIRRRPDRRGFRLHQDRLR